jgi:hypothetical protein
MNAKTEQDGAKRRIMVTRLDTHNAGPGVFSMQMGDNRDSDSRKMPNLLQ